MSTQMANFYNACRKRITNGEKLLDEHLGELWDEKIDFKTLNLGYCNKCICGQLKFEINVVDKDRQVYPVQTSSMSSWHGFYAGYIPHGVRGLKRTEILQKLWVERIKQRRERRKKLQPFSVMLGSDLSKISEFNTCG